MKKKVGAARKFKPVSPMEYIVVRPDRRRTRKIGAVGNLLTHLAADRGWELQFVVPLPNGNCEYVMSRRRR
jgi:hypothetical protein